MQKYILQKHHMFLTVIHVCDAQPESWNDLPAFVGEYEIFKTKTGQLSNNIQEFLITGKAETKAFNRAKQHAGDQMLAISKALVAIALKTGDVILENEAHFVKRELHYGRKKIALENMKFLMDVANVYAEQLADYGIAAAELELAQEAVDRMEQLIAATQAAKSKKSALTSACLDLIKENSQLLEKHLDTVISINARKLPMFVDAYFKARKTYNYGVRHKQGTSDAVFPPTERDSESTIE